MPLETLKKRFTEIYGGGTDDIRVFFAPGRVNLIGEYTDINGGHVFPCATTRGICGAVRLRADDRIRLVSANMDPEAVTEVQLDALKAVTEPRWVQYPLGVFAEFELAGHRVPCGMDLYFDGDLPMNAGLGSSAALTTLTAKLIQTVCGFDDLNGRVLAKIAMRAEQAFAGLQCGIMDPFASAMGRRGQAIFLSSMRMAYHYVPLRLDSQKIVLTDTLLPRENIHSLYNERRRECERALRKFQSVINIHCLCDVNRDNFEHCKDVLMDPVLVKRARHVVYENVRTIRALSAFRVNKLALFGRLMNESHASLRDDFEVSCPELDFLAEEAAKKPYVIGSRMMGAGFGGCTVSIVETAHVTDFEREIGTAYQSKFGKLPKFYEEDAGDGAREVTESIPG